MHSQESPNQSIAKDLPKQRHKSHNDVGSNTFSMCALLGLLASLRVRGGGGGGVCVCVAFRFTSILEQI